LRSDLHAKLPEAAAALDDVLIHAPAFLLTELTEAFQIGFLLFVPFLVIDLVVGNVLLAMGMQMLTPQTIALPLKLLLFVLIDGWSLILSGLVSGYL
jgi:type III secretion protein R